MIEKEYYYKGKTYTKDGLKRQLMKDKIIQRQVATIYSVIDPKYECDDWGWTYDIEFMLEHLRESGLIEYTEDHFSYCGGRYPHPFGLEPEDKCSDCPNKDLCRKGKI